MEYPGSGPSRERIAAAQGCLLGGAVAEALCTPSPTGAANNTSLFRIMNGEDFPFASAKVRFDANTQMTLFTAEGLLRGQVRFANKGIGPIYTIIVAHAYQRWVATQGCSVHHEVSFDGWLYEQKLLNRRRNPDRKAIQAVQRLGAPGADRSYKTDAVNHGPSGVARIAPVGIFAGAELRPESYAEVFKLGCEIAQITHRSPEGYLPAGFLALLIALILNGNDFDQAAHTSLDQLAACAGKGNVHEALEYAVSVPPPDLNRVALDLGNGRHGHEALALSLLICRVAPSFPEGMVLALRFGGYGKSVATVTGNIMGAMRGLDAIEATGWLRPLEGRDIVEAVASDLVSCPFWRMQSDEVWQRYPGH